MLLIKKTKVADGYVWFCKSCSREKTCRYGSIFEFLKTLIIKIFKTVQKFSSNRLQNDTRYDLDKSKCTVSDWFTIIREIIQDHLMVNPRILGGLDENGNKKIVEIDESLFFRRKYERGRIRTQQWVLGMIEREKVLLVFFITGQKRIYDTTTYFTIYLT
ncbi:hypothetical protein DMUE_5628 [Dictyocoela muelleri]|nr:hypothetical protein DMUE_5628 [Dictyocoela muelleri]